MRGGGQDDCWRGEPLHLKRGFLALARSEVGLEGTGGELSAASALTEPLRDTVYSAVFPRHGTRVDRGTLDFLLGFGDAAERDCDAPAPLVAGRALRDHCLAGGRVAVVVPEGALSSRALTEGRAALLGSGCLERVVRLPPSCFEGSGRQGALLVLSRGNASVEFCRATIFGSREFARVGERSALPVGTLLDGEAVRLDRAFLERMVHARRPLGRDGGTRLGGVAWVRMGLNARRCGMEGVPKPEAKAYLVGPGDMEGGRWIEGSGAPVAGKPASLQPLQEGDVVVARAGAWARARVFSGGGAPLYPLDTLIVITPAWDVDPYFLAAFLNGPDGLSAARSGGGTKHVGVQAIRELILPGGWREIQDEMGSKYREALLRLEEARRRVDEIEREVSMCHLPRSAN